MLISIVRLVLKITVMSQIGDVRSVWLDSIRVEVGASSANRFVRPAQLKTTAKAVKVPFY